MKKMVILLCLSFFIGIVNAASMPFEITHTNSATSQTTGHDHCQATASTDHREGGAAHSSASAGHYCCSAVAVLGDPPIFGFVKQSHIYWLGYTPKSFFHFAESIYKPPKNQA